MNKSINNILSKYHHDVNAEGIFWMRDKTSGYKMNIRIPGQTTNEGYNIVFNLPNGIPITPGELSFYQTRLMTVTINESTKCLEIGAGLAEWIPYLLENYKLRERPTVIEMADYQKMIEMMRDAILLKIHPEVTQRLELLIRTCKTYLDTKKVTCSTRKSNLPISEVLQ